MLFNSLFVERYLPAATIAVSTQTQCCKRLCLFSHAPPCPWCDVIGRDGAGILYKHLINVVISVRLPSMLCYNEHGLHLSQSERSIKKHDTSYLLPYPAVPHWHFQSLNPLVRQTGRTNWVGELLRWRCFSTLIHNVRERELNCFCTMKCMLFQTCRSFLRLYMMIVYFGGL